MADPSQILSERNAEVAKIRGFVDLTEEAKDRRIAEVNERANAEYAAAKEAEKRGREERLKSTQRAVFNVVSTTRRPPRPRRRRSTPLIGKDPATSTGPRWSRARR
jgi:hypothetical protein